MKVGAVCAFAVALFSFASGTHSQTGMGSPGFSGLWQPTVGAGASYEVQKEGQPKQPFEFAIIASEKVQGKEGVWVEFTIAGEQIGVMVIKELVAVDAAKMQMQTFKAVVQLPGHPPMELPDEMIQSQQPFRFNDVRAEGVDLVANAKDKISGTPQPFDPMMFIPQHPQQ